MSLPSELHAIHLGGSQQYQVARSLRFRSSNSAYLSRTFGSGNRSTWTWSGWCKYSNLGTTYRPFLAYSTSAFGIGGASAQADCLYFNQSGVWSGYTAAVFRDPSAWYHVMFVYDTTQATAANRIKVYVNGVQYTFTTEGGTLPSQNSSGPWNQSGSHTSMWNSGWNYFDGYAAEINFIDGQALTPSSFGQTDSVTGAWIPTRYTGTYGTNGFYLKYTDNSGATATTIGKDNSINGNNWTPSGISVTADSTNDSVIDSPTNYGSNVGNYAVLNPVMPGISGISNGNLNTTSQNICVSTIGFSTGKFGFQWTCNGGTNEADIGCLLFSSGGPFSTATNYNTYRTGTVGAIDWYTYNGNLYNETSLVAAYGASWVAGDKFQMFVDADAGNVYLAKNGTLLNSGNAVITGKTGKTWWPYAARYAASGNVASIDMDFGQQNFNPNSILSGYNTLCTQNLPTPSIGLY